MSYCCLSSCRLVSPKPLGLSYHAFPPKDSSTIMVTDKYGERKYMDRWAAWVFKLRITGNVTKSMKVCSLHFKEDDYIKAYKPIRRMLKRTAIPTLNLPDDEDRKDDTSLSRKSQEFILQNVVYIKEKNPPDKLWKGEISEVDPLGDHTSLSPYENITIKKEGIGERGRDYRTKINNKTEMVFIDCKSEMALVDNDAEINLSDDKTKINLIDENGKLDEHNVQKDGNRNISKTEQPYQCPFCIRRFRTWPLLAKHNISHMDMRTLFGCNCCEYKCNNMESLNMHIKEKHGLLNGEKCKACKKTFFYHRDANNPDINPCNLCGIGRNKLKVATSSNLMFLCDRCPFITIIKAKLVQHLQTEHKISSPHICELCGMIFVGRFELKIHMQQKHSSASNQNPIESMSIDEGDMSDDELISDENLSKTLTCPECSTECFDFKKFIEHLRLAHGKCKQFLCEACAKIFPTNELLDEHMLTHREQTPYVCFKCRCKFKSKLKLRNHFRKVHADEDDLSECVMQQDDDTKSSGPFLCDVCAFICPDRLDFILHIRKAHNSHFDPIAHHKERKEEFEVKYEGKMKKCKIAYEDATTNTEKFQCSRTTYSGKFEANLKKHVEKVQDGAYVVQIEYECNHCRKAFPTRYAMTKHAAIHTNNVKKRYFNLNMGRYEDSI